MQRVVSFTCQHILVQFVAGQVVVGYINTFVTGAPGADIRYAAQTRTGVDLVFPGDSSLRGRTSRWLLVLVIGNTQKSFAAN